MLEVERHVSEQMSGGGCTAGDRGGGDGMETRGPQPTQSGTMAHSAASESGSPPSSLHELPPAMRQLFMQTMAEECSGDGDGDDDDGEWGGEWGGEEGDESGGEYAARMKTRDTGPSLRLQVSFVPTTVDASGLCEAQVFAKGSANTLRSHSTWSDEARVENVGAIAKASIMKRAR
jgi:hypothetical protein